MKNKLITALRVAANALEKQTFNYNWKHPDTCNCGVVICAMLGKSIHGLRELLPDGATTWASMVGDNCPVTGVPTDIIFGELHKQGMTPEDVVDLEYLRNPQVLARCDFGTATTGALWWKKLKVVKPDYKQRGHVIVYLRAWAALLTEQGADDHAETPTEQKATA